MAIGLASYKQNSPLSYAAAPHPDVFAVPVCKMHLLNAELQAMMGSDEAHSRRGHSMQQHCSAGRARIDEHGRVMAEGARHLLGPTPADGSQLPRTYGIRSECCGICYGRRDGAADCQHLAGQPHSLSDGWKVVYAGAKEQADSSLPWCAQLLTDVAQLGEEVQQVWRNPARLTAEDGFGMLKWRHMVTKAVRSREQHQWWRCITERPALQVYAQLKRSAAGLAMEAYLSAPHGGWNDLGLVGRKALTRIRCGHHELRVCSGAWDGLDVEDRWCPLCA